jgi:hypothetical protein
VHPKAKKDSNEEPKIIQSDECEWERITGTVKRLPEPRTPEVRFELGQRVRDIVTGFTGIAVGRMEHLNRCWTYDVQAEQVKKEDGATGAYESFQSNRLELIDQGLLHPKTKPVIPRASGPSRHSSSPKGY